jgi:hypothetical protein
MAGLACRAKGSGMIFAHFRKRRIAKFERGVCHKCDGPLTGLLPQAPGSGLEESAPKIYQRSGEIVRLVEEVPGVEKNERWYIWQWQNGKLWNGPARADGEAWAARNNVPIDFVERFEP